MVIQKRPPRLGRWFRLPTRNQTRDRSLGEFNSEFEQLAMNPGRTPERIGLGHFANKVTDFRADWRPPGSFASGLKSPKHLETFFMPTHHGLWFDNDQSMAPVAPETGKDNPENTITGTKLRPFDRPFHGGQLLAKREVLQNDIKSLFEPEKDVKEPVKCHFHHG